MKVVCIPVSPLSYRIIQAEYGTASPLHLPIHSELQKQLHYRPTGGGYRERQQHSLTVELSIAVDDRLAKQINEHCGSIGNYLFDQHKRRIFREVLALKRQNSLGRGGARGCLQEILGRYFVDEDDYASDTLERLWKRWKKNEEMRLHKHAPSVPQNATQLYQHELTLNQARAVADRLVKLLVADRVIDFDLRSQKALLPFVLYTYTDLSCVEVGRQLGAAHQSISRSVRRIRSLLSQHPEVGRILHYCLKTTKSCPVPNLAS